MKQKIKFTLASLLLLVFCAVFVIGDVSAQGRPNQKDALLESQAATQTDAPTKTSTVKLAARAGTEQSGSGAQPINTASQVASSAGESGTFGGLIPCGKRGSGAGSEPCTACHMVLTGKNLMDYLTGIMVVVAITVIVAMGVLYIMSGVNEGLKKTAKAGLTAVLFGLVFMLSAWLIVSTVLRFLANDEFVGNLTQGDGVYGLQCSTYSAGGKAILTPGGNIQAGGSGSGSGKCAPIQNAGNPCSVANLKKNPCWAALGDTVIGQASGICNAESQGIPTIRSGASATDHCGCANCPVVSQGLFQVNMTSHYDKIVCPKIAQPPLNNTTKHSDGWYDASCKMIVDNATFQTCANKTIDPAWNINYACQLYKERGNWGAWNYSWKDPSKCNSFK